MALPAPIALGDVVRLVYFQSLFGQRLNTVLHMHATVAPAGGTSYAQAMLNLAARFGDVTKVPLVQWKPIVGPQLNFDKVRAQRVFPTRDVYMEDLIASAGTHADDCTMPNAAMSIEKRTLHPLRAGVGRVQMGGIPASQIVDAEFTTAFIIAASACWDTIVGDLTVAADSSKWRVVLYRGAAVAPEDELFAVVPQLDVRTMHRRTLRVGE